MDFVNKFTGGGDKPQGENAGQNQQEGSSEQKSNGGGFLGGLGDKLNSAAGGGKESEKNEDYLDKGMLLFLPLFSTPPTDHLPLYSLRLANSFASHSARTVMRNVEI